MAGKWNKVFLALSDAGRTFDTGGDGKHSRPDVDRVDDGLYLGSLRAARDRDWLQRTGITHVLSVMLDWRDVQGDHDDLGLIRKFVPVADNHSSATALSREFDACYRWIRSAIDGGGRVLIHCLMGISRSSTVTASYLMRNEMIGCSAALAKIRQARPIIQPNAAFLAELKALDHQLTDACTRDQLVQEGPLPVEVVQLVLEYRGSLAVCRTFRLRYGDSFASHSYDLPAGMSLTAVETEDVSSLKLPRRSDAAWKPTTVTIATGGCSWSLVQLHEQHKSELSHWWLLQETDDTYTFYTVPHLPPDFDPENVIDDGATVLHAANPCFLVSTEPNQLLENPRS